MQFLKTLFWVALGIVLALFTFYNWVPVTIQLWGGLAADVKLPALVIVAFLLGFVPTLLLYRARLWTMRRRLETHERNAVMAQMAAATASAKPDAEEPASVQGADQPTTAPGSVPAS